MEQINTPNITEEDFSLQEIKSSYKALKDRIDRQQAFNVKMLRKAVDTKARSVHRTMLCTRMLSIFALIIWPLLSWSIGLNWVFVIFTEVMLAGDMVLDYWAFSPIRKALRDNQSLLRIAELSVQTQKRVTQDLYISLAAVVIWLGLLIWCITDIVSPIPEFGLTGMIVLVTIGAILGIGLAIVVVRRAMANLRDIEAQIQDYRDMEAQ